MVTDSPWNPTQLGFCSGKIQCMVFHTVIQVQPPSILWHLHPGGFTVLCFQPVVGKGWEDHTWEAFWAGPGGDASLLLPVQDGSVMWPRLPDSATDIGDMAVCPRGTETGWRRAGCSASPSLTQRCLHMIGMLLLYANICTQYVSGQMLSKVSRENGSLASPWLPPCGPSVPGRALEGNDVLCARPSESLLLECPPHPLGKLLISF